MDDKQGEFNPFMRNILLVDSSLQLKSPVIKEIARVLDIETKDVMIVNDVIVDYPDSSELPFTD